VLAFKLGGTATLPERRTVVRTAAVPEDLHELADDAELVATGRKFYEQYCYMCHGLQVMSGGVIPDLRYANPQTFSEWQSIVIGGSRADLGMRSFAGVLTSEDALAIRAYVIERAAKLH